MNSLLVGGKVIQTLGGDFTPTATSASAWCTTRRSKAPSRGRGC
jgi:hypothetical protein